MKPVVKGVIIGCSVLLVIGVVGVTAVIWLVSSKKDELMAQAKAAQTEGD